MAEEKTKAEKSPGEKHLELKAQVAVVLEKFNMAMKAENTAEQNNAVYETMQQEMAVLFLQHGGHVMQYMWGLNGDMNYDIVGDLNVLAGHPTSVKDVMEGVIDCMKSMMERSDLAKKPPALPAKAGPEYPAEVIVPKELLATDEQLAASMDKDELDILENERREQRVERQAQRAEARL